MKLFLWLMLSLTLTPIIAFLETFIFDDWEFVQFLAILVAGDTILGFIRSFKFHQVSSKGFGQIILKLLSYMSLLILAHVLTHYKVQGSPSYLFLWFDDMVYAVIIVREAISILENMASIYPQCIPDWLLKRLKEFDLKGKINTTAK